jgi:hypothetical protein
MSGLWIVGMNGFHEDWSVSGGKIFFKPLLGIDGSRKTWPYLSINNTRSAEQGIMACCTGKKTGRTLPYYYSRQFAQMRELHQISAQ